MGASHGGLLTADMDVRGYGDFVSLAFNRNQSGLSDATRRLSSGLRIQYASDDPSGLAISESLQSKVNGLDQGVRNVQDASNALTVAEGAMQTVSAMLQRMRAIVVQANSDLLSNGDRANLQVEINALAQEIDAIASKTSFNGKTLLDGSLSGAIAQPARVLIVQNDPLTGGGTLLDVVLDPTQPSVTTNVIQLTQRLTVDSYDPVTNTLQITAVITSPDAAFGGSQTATLPVDNGTNFPSGGSPPSPGLPTFTQSDSMGNPVLTFNIGTLTPNDVGKTAILITLPAESKAPGSALEINTGDAEGTTVGLDIPSVSTATLGVNDIVLSSDHLVNEGDEFRIDYAIEKLGNTRATVGAQIVSLHMSADNASIASVNYVAAESRIRDADIGAETVAFTRDTILRSFQTQLTSSLEHLQLGLMQLVTASILGSR